MSLKVLNISAVKAQQDIEDAGEHFDYADGGRYLIAFIGKEEFGRRLVRLEEMARQSRPEFKKRDNRGGWAKRLPTDLSDEISYKAMFGTIVLGWEGIKVDSDGSDLEFTEDNFIMVMKAIRGLAAAILDFSSERENYRKEQQEKNLGN